MGLMQTVRFSLDILSPFENVFLPKVHQLWTPLQHQLCSDCHLRQRQALQVLMVLVRSCPNFLRHRIVNEVLPHLLTFLESQAVSSHGKRRKAHVLTQAFKLQKLCSKKRQLWSSVSVCPSGKCRNCCERFTSTLAVTNYLN